MTHRASSRWFSCQFSTTALSRSYNLLDSNKGVCVKKLNLLESYLSNSSTLPQFRWLPDAWGDEGAGQQFPKKIYWFIWCLAHLPYSYQRLSTLAGRRPSLSTSWWNLWADELFASHPEGNNAEENLPLWETRLIFTHEILLQLRSTSSPRVQQVPSIAARVQLQELFLRRLTGYHQNISCTWEVDNVTLRLFSSRGSWK